MTKRQLPTKENKLPLWGLHQDGWVIWCGRFRPKKKIIFKKYAAWCDCNGFGPIEGSYRAKLCKVKPPTIVK